MGVDCTVSHLSSRDREFDFEYTESIHVALLIATHDGKQRVFPQIHADLLTAPEKLRGLLSAIPVCADEVRHFLSSSTDELSEESFRDTLVDMAKSGRTEVVQILLNV